MAGVREGQGQLVFGLDIGTRSIVGTVGYINGDRFHVLAQRSKEHETRSMLDGQIHDISKVGDTIAQVKRQLEDDLNRTLTEVCIAAAGRVLRTVTTHVEETFEAEREVTDEDIYALSTEGVEQAYVEFQKSNDMEMKFYCVGYTPMRYYLNGYQMVNLEGHKAKVIGVDLIATFLPDDVVDGLYKSVEQAGLHVANLTLEPIAAIHVAIPEKFRLLNMALVDVGAGTSDISITSEGTITAYGMIPVAGDSLTEIIVQHCLVDFETAERIKRNINSPEPIEYQDIMGLTQSITGREVLEVIKPAVEQMTHLVADCIKELNGDKPVSAVFVVGGGGTVPTYTETLAAELGILKERVAIRGQEVMQDIVFETENARRDSLMVTPIGICLSYYEQSNNFIFVEFNEQRLKLYDNGRISVADAAMQLAFPNEDLFPKRGKPLTYTVNGRAKMVRGTQGEAAVIKVNGDISDMYAQIHSGDRIEVTPSTAGEPAEQELGELTELSDQLHIYVNGTKIDLPKTAEVNGKIENEFYQIADGDNILVRNYYTVQEIATILDVILGSNIQVNDTPAKGDTRVYENFTVSFNMDGGGISYADLPDAEEGDVFKRKPEPEESADENSEGAQETDSEGTQAESSAEGTSAEGEPAGAQAESSAEGTSAEGASQEGAETATANAEGVSAEGEQSAETQSAEGGAAADASSDAEKPQKAPQKVQEAPRTIGPLNVTVNNEPITLKGKVTYVYVDVFDYINFDLSASAGRGIVTNLNGRPAEYMEELHAGDVIDIYWK
ncbi:MAG: rod shape-determining protein [Acetatifactor sp.]|nr:rod shape-determining protein [Acetatifactor sp.]